MLPLATQNLRNVQLDRMSSVVSTIAMFTDKVLDLSDLCAFSIIPVESQCIYTYAVIVEINFHSLTTQDFGGLYVYVRLPVFSVCSVHFPKISGCLLGICCHFAYLGTSTCTYNNLECVAVIARCNVLIIHLDVLLLTVKTWL